MDSCYEVNSHLLIRLLSEEYIERPELEGWLRASSEKEASGQPASLSSVNLQTIAHKRYQPEKAV